MRTEDGGRVIVKNAVPGQKVSASINKVRKGKCEEDCLRCWAFGERAAGGCLYPCRRVWRLHISDAALRGAACHEGVTGKKLIDDVIVPENTDYEFLGIKASPRQQEYRNKMEFSFGDAYKGGPLALGMHKRGSFMTSWMSRNAGL